MRSYRDIQAQQENVDRGGLKVTVMTADGTRPDRFVRADTSPGCEDTASGV